MRQLVFFLGFFAQVFIFSNTCLADPTLYSITNSSRVLRIDVGTGNVTHEATLDPILALNNETTVEFNPADGKMYLGGVLASPHTLSTVDLVTGAVSGISTSFDPNCTQNLGFHPDGSLYGTSGGRLFTIDIPSGTKTFVRDTMVDVDAMDFDQNGTLWFVDSDGVTICDIYRFEVSTGALTYINTVGPVQLYSLAIVDDTMYTVDFISGDLYQLLPSGTIEFLFNVGQFGRTPSLSGTSPCVSASSGNVNFGAASIEDVLFINGSSGGPTRTVNVATGQSVSIFLNSSSSGPSPAKYVMWVWSGTPANTSDLFANGIGIGCLVNPSPLHPDEHPQPFRCLRSSQIPPAVCTNLNEIGNAPQSAPWLVTKTSGLSQPLVLTLQGLVADTGSANQFRYSVTNAISLEVE